MRATKPKIKADSGFRPGLPRAQGEELGPKIDFGGSNYRYRLDKRLMRGVGVVLNAQPTRACQIVTVEFSEGVLREASQDQKQSHFTNAFHNTAQACPFPLISPPVLTTAGPGLFTESGPQRV